MLGYAKDGTFVARVMNRAAVGRKLRKRSGRQIAQSVCGKVEPPRRTLTKQPSGRNGHNHGWKCRIAACLVTPGRRTDPREHGPTHIAESSESLSKRRANRSPS